MLIIHNGNETEPLKYFKELAVKTRVNGERSLSFILLNNDDNYSLVETGSVIEYNGQRYTIHKTNEASRGENSVKSVQCLHILFDLIDNDVTSLLNGSYTFQQVLNTILPSAYTYDIIDSFNSVTLEDWGEDNSLALFQDALNLFNAEFDVDNTHITIKTQIGNDTDFQFRFKHNIKTIEKSVEKVTGGVNLSIALSFAELKKAGYPYEVVNCGDTVFTIYEPMNINVTNRIVEYLEYPLEPKESKVTLANFKENVTDVMAKFSTTQKRFNKIVDNNDKVRINYLDDATQIATESLNNALTELEFTTNGIIARDPNDANRFVVLRSNGIGITTDGGVTFKEAITADGFVLSAGVIGELQANNIDVSGVISAINNEGSTQIDGGKVTITNNTDFTSVQSTANSADSTASSVKSLTDGWKYSNTTEIDGGKITTNTISASKINISSLSDLSSQLGGTSTNGTRLQSGWIQAYSSDAIVEVYANQIQFLEGTGSTGTWLTFNPSTLTLDVDGNFTVNGYEVAKSSHSHDGSAITSGTVSFYRLPTGTTSTTVAVGNHTHSQYASTSHTHDYPVDSVNGKTGTVSLSSSDVGAEPSFSKNTAFNKSFGTSSGTVAEGNHTHSGYASSSHTHGNTYVKDKFGQDLQLYQDSTTGRIVVFRGGTNLGALAWHS